MRVISIIWKTLAVAVALLFGMLGASQVGWSGAEVIVTAAIMGPEDKLGTAIVFAISGVISVGAIVLIYRLAKHVLWFAGPVFLYLALVPGAWNGYASDFDTTRVAVIRESYANAFALEHMKALGRYQTCNDERIELSDDGKAVCARTLAIVPGDSSER
jgi:hypothetical protein